MSQLSDELQAQYDAILTEIQPFIDSSLYHQGTARLNTILDAIPTDDEHRVLRGALFGARAELNLELEDDEAAWDDAQKAMNAGWYNATLYGIAGWAMFNLDKLDLAKDQFQKALEDDAGHLSSLMGRAMVYIDEEDFDSARVDLSKVIQLDASHATALATRAEVSVELEAYDSAMKDIEKARAIDSADPDFGLLHARLLLAKDAVDKAIDVLGETITDEDTLLEAILLRSHLHYLNQDWKKARRDALRASNTFSDESIAFVQLALVQLAMKSYTLAMKAAERAVELDPSLSDGYYVRSLAHEGQGNEAEAQTDRTTADKAPLELPLFLYGPLSGTIEMGELARAVEPEPAEPEAQIPNPFPGGIPGIPGLGGIDPTKMLDQLFDKDGNIRPAFKPILKMALKNAPAMMQSVPDSMLEKMGVSDKEQLENFDPSQLSEEQIEQQMKLFYKMLKAGKFPMDPK